MKYLICFLFAFGISSLANNAFGYDSTTFIENSAYHSDGTSSRKIGSAWYNSDGTSSTQIGNTLFHSDGGSSTQIGNIIFHNQ